jgi:chemotaxis signal transduction protein
VAEPETPSFDPIDEREAPDPQPEAVPHPGVEQVNAGETFSIDSIELPSITGAEPEPAPAQAEPQTADDPFSLDLLNALTAAKSQADARPSEVAASTQSAPVGDAPLSFDAVEAAAALSADEAGAESAAPQGVVRQGVRIGSLRLLLDFAFTSQLSELVPITPLPAMPHGLRGLASLHGNVLPVFDLASMLGIERSDTQREMLLVVGHGESAAAVLIDGLPDRFRLAEGDRAEVASPAGWLADCVQSGYAAGGETWLDLDHRRLLDKLEASLRPGGIARRA